VIKIGGVNTMSDRLIYKMRCKECGSINLTFNKNDKSPCGACGANLGFDLIEIEIF